MLTKKHTQDTQALEIFWLAARIAALEIFWLEASYSRKLLGNDSPGIPCEAEASTHFCTAAATSPVDSGKPGEIMACGLRLWRFSGLKLKQAIPESFLETIPLEFHVKLKPPHIFVQLPPVQSTPESFWGKSSSNWPIPRRGRR